jgi:hypothetical protein
MHKRFAIPAILGLALAAPAFSQRPGEGRPPEQRPQEQRPQEQRPQENRGGERGNNYPRGNQGRIPDPPQRREQNARPEPQRHDGGRINSVPHVANDHWYGHDAPNDRRYHLDHPFEHGHFEHFGPQYRYRIERFDRDRHEFWFPGGFYFQIASWDWDVAANWCWDCDADDFVVYDDPDHPGWYLLYNVHTGQYIHVQYMGS